MARLHAFDVHGVEMWIPSGDHEPPHFHARRPGEWTAKVYIQRAKGRMIEVKHGTIRRTHRTAIEAGVEEHRAELLEEWENCHGE